MNSICVPCSLVLWDPTYLASLSNICNNPYERPDVKSYSECNWTRRRDAYLSSAMTDSEEPQCASHQERGQQEKPKLHRFLNNKHGKSYFYGFHRGVPPERAPALLAPGTLPSGRRKERSTQMLGARLYFPVWLLLLL